MAKTKNKKGGSFLKWALSVLALVLAGGLIFIYGVLPGQVAKTIIGKAQQHKPLTKTPKDDGYDYKDVIFTADGGVTLSGWWMPPVGKKKPFGTVLLSHGFTKNREQVLNRAEFLVQTGYQVL